MLNWTNGKKIKTLTGDEKFFRNYLRSKLKSPRAKDTNETEKELFVLVLRFTSHCPYWNTWTRTITQ